MSGVSNALREAVCEANIELFQRGLAQFTFGNASGVDRERGLIVIKPSGVPLATLQADYTGSTNAFFSWYKNDKVVELLAKARATSVDSERGALYHEIQDIVYHDGYSVPLNFLPYVAAHGPQVKGWKTIAVGWWWLRDVWLDK